jgi:hypothetical protein
MQRDYLKRLPLRVRALVEEIETYAQLEVRIEASEPAPSDSLIVERGTPVTVRVEKDSGTIYVPTPNAFATDSILHELLHVRRFWVERVPMLHCAGQGVALDNALEHLVIVPAAKEYGVDPYPHWNGVFQAQLMAFRAPTDDPDALRQSKLAYASVQCEVNDHGVRAEWEVAIRERGHLTAAREFWDRLQPILGDKRAVLKLAFEELGANDISCRMRILDVRARAEWPLASWDL